MCMFRSISKYKPCIRTVAVVWVFKNYLSYGVSLAQGRHQANKMYGFNSILTPHESLKFHSLLHHQSGWKQVPEHVSEPKVVFNEITWCMEGHLWNSLWSNVPSNESPYLKCQYHLGEWLRWKKEENSGFQAFLTRYWEILMDETSLLLLEPWRSQDWSPTGLPSLAKRRVMQNPPWRPNRCLAPTGWSGWLKTFIVLSLNE